MDKTINISEDSCSSVDSSSVKKMSKVVGVKKGQKSLNTVAAVKNDDMDLTQDNLVAFSNAASSSSSSSAISSAGCNKMKRKSVGRSPKDNTKKKTHTALERAAKKQKLAEERAAKRTAAEANKIYKPGECIKHMTVQVYPQLHSAWYMGDVGRELASTGARLVRAQDLFHADLLLWTRTEPATLTGEGGQVRRWNISGGKHMTVQVYPQLHSAWYMGDVGRELASTGARLVRAQDLFHADLVLWTRTEPATLTGEGGQLKLSSPIACNTGLYILPAARVGELVDEQTLATHVGEVAETAACNVTLVVFGVKDYFKSSGRKTSNSNRNSMTEIDLEMAITDLLVSANCDTVLVNTPNELALLIVQFTKAIAEAPFKKAKRDCDEQAEFYMRGDNKKCVAIDRNGVGVSRLWQQMIAILPMSSLETSRALCGIYKSPLALSEALQSPNSTKELADIGVSRAAVPGSRARRLGPEFARKLKTLFTAEDGNVLLD